VMGGMCACAPGEEAMMHARPRISIYIHISQRQLDMLFGYCRYSIYILCMCRGIDTYSRYNRYGDI